MNILNIYLNDSIEFRKKLKFFFLKNSIHHKNFVISFSKFTRRNISKWKRRSNWLAYFGILNYWSADYLFYRNYVKYQFLSHTLKTSTYFYNFSYLKKKKKPFIKNISNFVFIFLNKNIFKYFNKGPFFLKNSFLLINYSNGGLDLLKKNNFLHFYTSSDNLYYAPLIAPTPLTPFDFASIIFFTSLHHFFNLFEIYKILVILFFLKTIKR